MTPEPAPVSTAMLRKLAMESDGNDPGGPTNEHDYDVGIALRSAADQLDVFQKEKAEIEAMLVDKHVPTPAEQEATKLRFNRLLKDIEASDQIAALIAERDTATAALVAIRAAMGPYCVEVHGIGLSGSVSLMRSELDMRQKRIAERDTATAALQGMRGRNAELQHELTSAIERAQSERHTAELAEAELSAAQGRIGALEESMRWAVNELDDPGYTVKSRKYEKGYHTMRGLLFIATPPTPVSTERE